MGLTLIDASSAAPLTQGTKRLDRKTVLERIADGRIGNIFEDHHRSAATAHAAAYPIRRSEEKINPPLVST
jgi:hypothetical protein